MSIKLYEHNRIAYERALAMLEEEGKAAIVHPTGTGKSFIGFKLSEDNPEMKVLWLSPSEYIFKTQLESVVKQGYTPTNILFYTYAKLTYLTEEEISELPADYIVMDEFHRAGAQEWGKSVKALMKTHLDVPVLGLSATNIRYLDNCRDMSDELFEGNVASEMTLGEAIIRGILNPPTYITALYSYKKELLKYERKVKNAKTKAARDAGERILESLRRAIGNADGLDVIFQKHIRNRNGKYIVFCANYESLNELKDKAEKMFRLVDGKPRVYVVYSDDPETDRAFAAFKSDGEDGLKLLYCIDMLNEGIHVADVDGVILFRPTVSPIIYKQQIGRALSASKERTPVIFDIVNNFENLYSIGAIEQEMQFVAAYYRANGQCDRIVNERFEVIDEVRDCRKLFDELNESLTASWELMYSYAEKYYAENGNLDVPKRYKTPEGYSLGAWIMTQRKVRSGEQYGKLGEDRIKKLDGIGMIWGSVRDLAWEKHYAEAKAYFDKNGDLNVPAKYVTESGFALGSWLSNLRTYRKSGIQSRYLGKERIAMLDGIGMLWDVPDYLWERNYAAALEYYKANGNLDVPAGYASADGIKLGNWIRRMRLVKEGKVDGAALTREQIARLNEIGMLWTDKFTRAWEEGYAHAKAYYEQHGDLDVSTTYRSADGFALGKWINSHRNSGNKSGTIRVTEERRARLDQIGMIWEKENPWDVRYRLAEDYYSEHGNLNMPAKYIVDGIWLNKWLNEQKQIFNGKRKGKHISKEQEEKLERLGLNLRQLQTK